MFIRYINFSGNSFRTTRTQNVISFSGKNLKRNSSHLKKQDEGSHYFMLFPNATQEPFQVY